MAVGLQYKENLSIISGGYPGEGVGSNGLVQDWTDTSGDSGSSTVTYYYHDSAQTSDSNSTLIEVNVTDSWSAQRLSDNTYRVTVNTTINSIVRTRIGNPSAFSTSIVVKQWAGGSVAWQTSGCDDATTSHTIATNINVGTHVIDLPPEDPGSERGTLYYRSNACGHEGDAPPSQYIDEFWMGINFRNTLPKDYRPGDTWGGGTWLSHNRNGGWAGIWNGSNFAEMRTADGPTGTGNPPLIKHSDAWHNQRKIGQE